MKASDPRSNGHRQQSGKPKREKRMVLAADNQNFFFHGRRERERSLPSKKRWQVIGEVGKVYQATVETGEARHRALQRRH